MFITNVNCGTDSQMCLTSNKINYYLELGIIESVQHSESNSHGVQLVWSSAKPVSAVHDTGNKTQANHAVLQV